MAMDFSYFSTAPQTYQFFGLPPTTSNTNPSHLDEYRSAHPTDQYDAAYATFQHNFQYDPNAFVPQAHQISTHSPSKALRHDSIVSLNDIDLPGLQASGTDAASEDVQPGRSSSEEKDILTPAQSRRKAQNRAAQRAFRERKEKHVKDLEAKLTNLQHQSVTLNDENERLRQQLAKVATENEILRATSGSQLNGPHPFMTEPDELVSPMNLGPIDSDKSLEDTNKLSFGTTSQTLRSKYAHLGSIKTLTVDEESGETLLGSGATWDYIQSHELFRNGLIDIGDVCDRLKKVARYDGKWPVFQECDIIRAINASATAGGRDELI